MKVWPVKAITLVVILIAASFLLTSPVPAHAWKPTTHVYFAELALQDALDDGKLTIYATDYESGKLLTDSAGNLLVIGEYPVDSQVLEVLRYHPQQFRAGVLGPDAYPDILTGQQIIHPGGADSPGQPSGVDINMGGPGSDPWLVYLWNRAFTGCNPNGTMCNSEDTAPANKAFVLGFLAHAAGDMYGHTFINYYTGGPFHFTPSQENAIKHVVLEGYIDKRTPELTSYEASIGAGVDLFIYRNMVNALPNSHLAQNLLTGQNKDFSLPYVFSKLRMQLEIEIKQYYDTLADYNHRYDEKIEAANNCQISDFTCSKTVLLAEAAKILADKASFVATNRLQVAYKEAWRDDIDSGLRALPAVSHELAKALFFNPGGLDRTRAQKIAEDYTNQHLLSMAGLPDAVGASLDLINKVLEAIGIPAIKQAIEQMKRDLLNYLLVNAFGITIEEIEQYLKNPETQFDPVLNNPAFNQEGTGHLVDLQEFNKQQLHISDPAYKSPEERYNYQIFPAAYNSVVMIKLLLMSRDGINQLLRDLRPNAPKTLAASNVMLGFARTLDGSNQWIINPEKMVLADDCIAYRKIFMRQVGEAIAPCEPVIITPPPPITPVITPTDIITPVITPTMTSTVVITPAVTATPVTPLPDSNPFSSQPNWFSFSWLMTIVILILLITLLILCSVSIMLLLLCVRIFFDWPVRGTKRQRGYPVTESMPGNDSLTAL